MNLFFSLFNPQYYYLFIAKSTPFVYNSIVIEMKKKIIKLNVDDNHLSLGNFCRILKQYAVNKSAALQMEIFSALFEADNIQDTTVNNYCIGLRSIGDEYKQKYLILQKKYIENSFCMVPIVGRILSILDGKLYLDMVEEEFLTFINSSSRLEEVCFKLYNVAKNDTTVSQEFSREVYDCLKNKNIYEGLVDILFFIVLEKKQPIYEEDIKKKVIENILSQTTISSSDLEEFLNLKFCEGSNYYYYAKKLAETGNAYACFELGTLEYDGHIKGYPRYDISYSYFLQASQAGHPSAYYYIGRMFYNKNIGAGGNEELEYAYQMFEKASSLGCVSAFNSLGLYYLRGIYPVKKDKKVAISYFEEASAHEYVYAYNNLGKIYEKEKKYDKAFSYYFKSASLGESWACNKVGECYRLGIGTKRDLKKAFSYYQKGLDVPNLYLCYYNMYNLAKYFYFSGCLDIVPISNLDKAISYFQEASAHGVFQATVFLFYYSVQEYLTSRDTSILQDVYYYKKLIEGHSQYHDKIREEIMEELKKISIHHDIDISSIL